MLLEKRGADCGEMAATVEFKGVVCSTILWSDFLRRWVRTNDVSHGYDAFLS